MNEVCSLITDGTHVTPQYQESGIPFISTANIVPFRPFDFSSYSRFISEKEHEELSHRCYPRSGDILLAKIGTLGLAKIVDVDYEFSIFVGLALLKLRRNFVDGKYLEQLLNMDIYHRQMINASPGSTRPTLTIQHIKKIPIFFPPLPEQRRIAEILETVDRTIIQTERLIEKLRAIKSGLLHDLLTRGIGEDGRVRSPEKNPDEFKDTDFGLIPQDWIIDVLDNAIRIIDCKHYTPHYVSEGIPIVRPRNIKTDGMYFSDIDYVTQEEYAILTDKHKPKMGDIVFSRNVSSGVPCYVRENIRFTIGQDVVIMTETNVDSLFIFYTLMSNHVRKQIDRELSGSTFVRINLAAIRDLRILVPSRREQERIAETLDVLDTRTKIEERSLKKLKLAKQGLMYDLLTGRVRVLIPKEEDGVL